MRQITQIKIMNPYFEKTYTTIIPFWFLEEVEFQSMRTLGCVEVMAIDESSTDKAFMLRYSSDKCSAIEIHTLEITEEQYQEYFKRGFDNRQYGVDSIHYYDY